MEKNINETTEPRPARTAGNVRLLWKAAAVGIIFWAISTTNSHAALAITGVDSVDCAALGATIPVTFTYSGGSSGVTLRYLIGFSDQSDPNGSPISWTGSHPCGNAGYTKTLPSGSTGSVTQSVTLPASFVAGHTITTIIVAANLNGSSVTCNNNHNGNTGITVPCVPTPTPTLIPTATFTPTPCSTPQGADTLNFQGGCYCFATPMGTSTPGSVNPVTLISDTSVFGMSLADVKNIADFTGTSLGSSPTTLNITSDWKLSYFDGSLTFDPTYAAPYNRLNAYGVLVVNGDLTLNPGVGNTLSSFYGGVIFVTGNLVVKDGCEIDGAVIMGKPYYHTASGVGLLGAVTVTGSGGNYGIIQYHPGLVSKAQQLVAQYRENIASRKLLLAVPNL